MKLQRLIDMLNRRGVRYHDTDADQRVLVSCISCGAQWHFAAQRTAEPVDEASYWWCPNGCNHEQ